MGFIEGLVEWAMGMAGLAGIFILLLVIAVPVFVVGVFIVLVRWVLIEDFTHDENFKLIPWRVALIISAVVALFAIRWYLPLALVGVIGLVGMFAELTGL